MVVKFLPLVDELASLDEKPYVKLLGQLIFNGEQSANEIVDFINKSDNLMFIAVFFKKGLYSADEAIYLLNNGVSLFFVDDGKLLELLESFGIPSDRVVVRKEDKYDCSKFRGMNKFSAREIIPLSNIDADNLHEKLLVGLRTDRLDGLYSTLVVDSYDRCLGLVYSSKESLKQAITTGLVVYYSHSRSGIWVKGGISENTQRLLQITADCDGDALKFMVTQASDYKFDSNFCHMQTESCFGGFTYDLVSIERLLKSRMVNLEDSYTKRLYEESDLLAAKIKEEANQVVRAKKKNEIIREAADLLYFTMVKMTLHGIELKEVIKNLNIKNMKITTSKGDTKP